MAAINLDVGANTRRAERDIQKLVSKSYNINLKTKGDQPLGRITGKVNEFTKSLDASNARVIAFGASAGLIYGVERAFAALASSVINTQKSLAEINVILNTSSSELNKFGSSLFGIAKNTGQSFEEVAKAATEFSRQGLGIVETLKRTNEALILSRLSGLDAAKSVEALTAAVNSFASQAVTATEIVNKFANVDAAFAVSSADLADAISRVGSSAAQSGVNLDELIAIVTSAQQTTARGGAVIGNSFKTIFTRLQRTKTIDLLESLGVNTRDASGEVKSTINLLTDLAKVYDQLGTLQQAEVAEKVGGVFQINILKAALSDLGKEFSVYNNALQVAGSSTDQAIRRNEELNKTYAAQLNALQENAKQLGASVGDRLFGPAFNRVVGNTNDILGGINAGDGNSIGATLGKGILDGLGQVIAGPGLALLGGIFIKLFADLSKFVGGSLQELLNLNNASKQQQALQQSISGILQKNPDLFKLMQQGSAGLNKGAEILLNSLRAQTIELQKQEAIAAKIAAQFLKTGGVKVTGGIPFAPTPGPKVGKAFGYIPNFAGVSKKQTAGEIAGALDGGYMPGPVMKKDGMVFNGAEERYKYAGVSKPEIRPPKGSKAGEKHRDELRSVLGYVPGEEIPNFALKGNYPVYAEYARNLGLNFPRNKPEPEISRIVAKGKTDEEIKAKIKSYTKDQSSFGDIKEFGLKNIQDPSFGYLYASPGSQKPIYGNVILPKAKKPVPFSFSSIGLKQPANFEQQVEQNLPSFLQKMAQSIYPDLEGSTDSFLKYVDKSATNQFLGRIFEVAINRALDIDASKETGTSTFEFYKSDLARNSAKLNKIFNGNIDGLRAGDLKFSPPDASGPSTLSFVKKMITSVGGLSSQNLKGMKLAAQGYIPNFSALQDAISRERSAGVPKSKIYIAQDKKLASSGYNPFGLGVFNTREEPTSSARSQAIKSKGYASGYIPNFAGGDDTAPESLSSSIAAISAQLGSLAIMLSFSTGQYKKSLEEMTQATRKAAQEQLKKARAEARKFEQPGERGFIFGGRNPDLMRQEASQKFRQSATPGIIAGGGAALGANALAVSLIAPIIAETVANAIGQQSKEARVGSSGVSALGQAASFAGFGAMMTPANPLIGGGIGLAAGAMLGLVDVIKQANTNIPELSEAARKASENLTKINDAGQKVQTQFEQVQQLRGSGQGEKAGKLEADLLKLIGKEFRDSPELASQAASAVINKDVQSLVKALEENTRAVSEQKAAADRKLLIGEFAEQSRPKDLGNQFLDIFDISATNTPVEQINRLLEIIPKEGIDLQALQRESGSASASGLGYIGPTLETDKITKISQNLIAYAQSTDQFKALGEDQQKELLRALNNSELVANLVNQVKDPIADTKSTWEAISRNSALGNKVIAAITDALSQAQSIYAKFATNAQAAVDLQLTGQRVIREASKGIAESQGGRDARILTAAGNPAAAENVRINTEIKKFNTEFANEVNSSFDSIISNVAGAFIQNGQKTLAGLTEIGSGQEGAQSRASQNIDAAATFAEAFKQQFNIENFKDLIGIGEGTDLANFEGFNVQSVLNEISSKLGINQDDTEGKALLEKIEESLNEANQKLLEQKGILAQQLTVLANNEFAANFEELMSAITKSFGGMESFRNFNNQFELTDELNRAIGSLSGLSKASGPNTDIETARAISSIVEELSKLAGSNIVTDRTGALRAELSPVIDAIVKGRATDIEKTINGILSGPLSKTGQGGALQTAFLDELIENLGIDRKKEDGTLKTQQELVSEVALRNAEMQTKAELGVGDVNKALLDESFKRLPENLQKIFKEQGMGQFNSIEQIAAAQQVVHTQLLEEIVNVLKGMSGINSFKGNGFNTNREIGTTFNEDAAGGGGINPVGVGAATDITSNTPENVVDQANYPGQDPVSKSFNEGVSMLQDATFKGLDGKDKTISKFPNKQAPFDLTSGLTTKISDLDGVIGSVINPDMIPDNSPENPLLPPKNMIDTGINDAIGSGIDDIVKNNPDLQSVAGLISSEYQRAVTVDELNNKYLSSSSSSYAKGYLPEGLKKEQSSIRKGVGGAKPWHSPYMTEINGEPAWVHDGEMIVPNMGNTGETGVLTPDMQKALNFAEGYIPSEEMVNRLIKEANIDPDKFDEFLEWSKAIGSTTNSEKEFLKSMGDYKAANLGFYRDEYKLQKVTAQSKQAQKIEQLRDLIRRPSTGAGEREAAEARLKALLAKTPSGPSNTAADTIKEVMEEIPKASRSQTTGATKAAGKGIAKGVGKGVAKGALKQIPIAGTLLGLGFAAYRLAQGDYIGAGLEASSTIPGLGIGSSAALIAYDMQKENESVTAQSYGNQQTAQIKQQNQKKPLAEQAKMRREAAKAKPKPIVNMPAMPTSLDFANAATRNRQQTQFNRQITATQTKPTNPFRLIGGKGNAPATQIDTRTGTGTLVPRAEAVNPNRGISTSTSYAQDPEVQKAIKTGNISAIEKATAKARERAGKSFETPESDFARKYKFEQDLSKAIGGIATGGTQAEVDAYYKKKAEEAGMSDRFITDYIEPRERSIIRQEEQKLNPPKRNFTEKGARGRLKDMMDGYDALMRGNRSMSQTQAYQAKKQELQRLFNSGNFEGIYNTYDSLPKSDQSRGFRTEDGSFIVAPPTPIPEPKYKNPEEARADGRQVLKAAPVGAYTRKDGKTLFNAPYINEEIPRAMAAANEAATMASIKQTLAISDFNSGRGPDPRKMDFTPTVLPPVLDYSSSVSQPGLAGYNRTMNLSPINPGGIDLYENLKGVEQPDGSVSTGIPKSWDTIYKIEEEKKKAKNYAQGLVNRSFLAELANGGNPLKDNIPGIGPVVIDKDTEYSAANAVARKGLSQGMYESRKMQNISAQSFVPNFAVKKAETQESANNFSIKLGDMVINSSAVQNNPELYGKDFGAELQSRIPDVVEQIKADMDKKYGRAMELVKRNENMFSNKIPPKSRGNAALKT